MAGRLATKARKRWFDSSKGRGRTGHSEEPNKGVSAGMREGIERAELEGRHVEYREIGK